MAFEHRWISLQRLSLNYTWMERFPSVGDLTKLFVSFQLFQPKDKTEWNGTEVFLKLSERVTTQKFACRARTCIRVLQRLLERVERVHNREPAQSYRHGERSTKSDRRIVI